MAEDPGQIRQAIEETRAEIAGTVQALGEKADVKGRLNQAVAEKTSELRGRATELQESARQALPPAAQSKADSAIGSTRRVAGTVMSDPAKKRTAAWVAGAVVALLLLRRRRGRR